jgi:acetylornithine deacetylase
MRPVTAHKGVRALTVVVRGRDGHSSKPALGANAVVAAARIAAHVDEAAAGRRAAGGDPRFDPPETTFNVATIRGGQAINIIPRHAELTFEYRPVPADDGWALADEIDEWAQREVLPDLQRVDPDCSIEVVRGTYVPGLAPEAQPAGTYDGVASAAVRDGGGAAGRVTEAGAAEALVRDLLGFTGEAGSVPFGTDGGWHQDAGISTVVCGPGDIDQAHQPDEFIDPAQLGACDAFLAVLADHLAT